MSSAHHRDVFAHGIILGRFNPPHYGHTFLIDIAVRCSRTTTLFLCSLPTERIPGALRMRWLQQMFPSLTVVHIDTANSEAVQGNPHAVTLWAEAIRSHLDAPADALFASEHYGVELAKQLNVTFCPVDTTRTLVAISGKKIRQNPLRYWRYIPAHIKGYFVFPIIIHASAPEQELRYAKTLAHYTRGTVFSPPDFATNSEELLQHYLLAQLSISYRVIVLCGWQFEDASRLLPQTYYAPLRIRIVRIRRGCRFRVYSATAQEHSERTTSTYRVSSVLKRITRYYLHKNVV